MTMQRFPLPSSVSLWFVLAASVPVSFSFQVSFSFPVSFPVPVPVPTIASSSWISCSFYSSHACSRTISDSRSCWFSVKVAIKCIRNLTCKVTSRPFPLSRGSVALDSAFKGTA